MQDHAVTSAISFKTDVSSGYEYVNKLKLNLVNWGSCGNIRTEAVALSPRMATLLYLGIATCSLYNLGQISNSVELLTFFLVLSMNAIHIQHK